MKRCSYCGKDYSDDATVCAIDQEPLADVVQGQPVPAPRGKVSGVWRGAYGYEYKRMPVEKAVPFTFVLKQGWLGHFTGTVTEDAPAGMPGTGRIDGYFAWPTIEFTKQMPVGYFTKQDGSRITLREYFLDVVDASEEELPSPPVSYEGTFLDGNRVQGIWILEPRRISLADGWSVTVPRTSGLWCAEFVTTDTKARPGNGTQRPFFDKSALPEPEPQDEANPAFRTLGKFPVADAELVLKRFKEANVRFEISRDDSAMRQMMPFTAITGGYSGTAPMMEIFVHPNDETKARDITNDGSSI